MGKNRERSVSLFTKAITTILFYCLKKDPDSKAEGNPPCLSLLDVKRESSVIQMPSNSEDYPSFHSSFSIREPE